MPARADETTIPAIALDRTALFLDVDGTLLDIAPAPSAVVVTEELKRLLRRLHEATGGALALISGRSIGDLDGLFTPLRLPAAGQHGAEFRLHPDDAVTRLEGLPDALRHAALGLALRHPDLLVEDKGSTLALHVRQNPALAPEVGSVLDEAVRAFPDHELLHGKAVFELRRRGQHKGMAVAAFLQEPPYAGKFPVFIGDDTTDEDAIRLVGERGGLGLRVGPDEFLRQPADVHAWLTSLLGERS